MRFYRTSWNFVQWINILYDALEKWKIIERSCIIKNETIKEKYEKTHSEIKHSNEFYKSPKLKVILKKSIKNKRGKETGKERERNKSKWLKNIW